MYIIFTPNMPPIMEIYFCQYLSDWTNLFWPQLLGIPKRNTSIFVAIIES